MHLLFCSERVCISMTSNFFDYDMDLNAAFPAKLFNLMENGGSAIGWLPRGDSFSIFDAAKFAELLPVYFKHKKLSSFQRQLNLYGFRRDKEAGSYHHPLFLRGRRDLVHDIRRAPNKSTSNNSGAVHAETFSQNMNHQQLVSINTNAKNLNRPASMNSLEGGSGVQLVSSHPTDGSYQHVHSTLNASVAFDATAHGEAAGANKRARTDSFTHIPRIVSEPDIRGNYARHVHVHVQQQHYVQSQQQQQQQKELELQRQQNLDYYAPVQQSVQQSVQTHNYGSRSRTSLLQNPLASFDFDEFLESEKCNSAPSSSSSSSSSSSIPSSSIPTAQDLNHAIGIARSNTAPVLSSSFAPFSVGVGPHMLQHLAQTLGAMPMRPPADSSAADSNPDSRMSKLTRNIGYSSSSASDSSSSSSHGDVSMDSSASMSSNEMICSGNQNENCSGLSTMGAPSSTITNHRGPVWVKAPTSYEASTYRSHVPESARIVPIPAQEFNQVQGEAVFAHEKQRFAYQQQMCISSEDLELLMMLGSNKPEEDAAAVHSDYPPFVGDADGLYLSNDAE